jgi:hypothetical protein
VIRVCLSQCVCGGGGWVSQCGCVCVCMLREKNGNLLTDAEVASIGC